MIDWRKVKTGRYCHNCGAWGPSIFNMCSDCDKLTRKRCDNGQEYSHAYWRPIGTLFVWDNVNEH